MKYSFRIFSVVMATLLLKGILFAKTIMAVFAGHKKETMGFMFIKFIKNKEVYNSKFLFFNRNLQA